MKTLHFSDIHLDALTAGKPRYREVVAFLYRVQELIDLHNPDLVTFAGDAFDPGGQLDALYSSAFMHAICGMLHSLCEPVVVAVAGNHDVVDTSELWMSEPLTTLSPLLAAQQFASPDDANRLCVFNKPNAIQFADDWVVLGLPYLSRAHAASAAEWDTEAIERAAEHRAAGRKIIVVAHRVIPGARMGSESYEMARGQEQLFPFKAVEALEPALVINGHYHARQTIDSGRLQINVPGSPVRFTFGEAEEVSKGVLLAEVP